MVLFNIFLFSCKKKNPNIENAHAFNGEYVYNSPNTLSLWVTWNSWDDNTIEFNIAEKDGNSCSFQAYVYGNCFVSDPEQQSIIANGCIDNSKNTLTIHYKKLNSSPIDIVATKSSH